MPYIYREEDRIFYQFDSSVHQTDKTIVLLHTNSTDHSLFDTIVPYLNQNYNLLRYDLRGHGLTDLGEGELNLSIFVEDLHFILTSLDINSFHLLGFNFGATIAVNYATTYGQGLEKLILMSMPSNPPHIVEKIRLHHMKMSKNGTHIPIDYTLKMTVSLPEDHFEVTKMKQIMSKMLPSTYSKLMDLSISSNPITNLHSIEIETLIITAENERLFPPYWLAMHVQYLPHCHYLTMPNTSHFMFLEKPSLSANWILDFLKKTFAEPVYDEFIMSISNDIRYQVRNVFHSKKKNSKSVDLTVSILNGFQVKVGSREILKGWNQRFAKNILIYLLFHRTSTREQICEAIWPHISINQSKANFRVYLSYLKSLLNSNNKPLILIEGEIIRLKGNIKCDLIHLITKTDELSGITNSVRRCHQSEKVLYCLQENFMTVIYDEWFMKLRGRIEYQISELTLWIANYYMSMKDYNRAIQCIKHCFDIVEGNEKLYALIIRCYEAIGDNKKAESWMRKREMEIY
ncbi:alpha/beta hydrolase [Terrilactibacillus laevilacticus]|uniref:alpha/beta hydrolase n=1 Tax=Terrilactibacillus laevilacticus TaxID=1380157 RepID=UPI0015EF3E01|nr:alpha/beta hydrolase [Terrilactibacillus laevilacticus]